MTLAPVAYYCDHSTLDTDKHPHFALERGTDGSWQVVKLYAVVHALEFADQATRAPSIPAELRNFNCPSAQPLYVPVAKLAEAAKRALTSLEDLIADSRDPGVEALGARWELAEALGALHANKLPLEEPGFLSTPTP